MLLGESIMGTTTYILVKALAKILHHPTKHLTLPIGFSLLALSH
jgi:hypothetical protein